MSEAEREAILLVQVGTGFGKRDEPCLLVTDNAPLLNHRLNLESKVGVAGLTSPWIVTADEALELLDLYAKYQDKHLIGPSTSSSKWYWYWLALRSLVPRYHVGSVHERALANRYVFLLMSLDEMGFRYYSCATNTAMTDTVYHFNYAISLITGIFDSLALIARDKLKLQFEDDNIPERTSLNPRAGEDFLRALRKKNASLRKHINDHVLFIKLIASLREKVVHREMLEETGFEHANEKWKANLLKIEDATYELVRQCGDGRQPMNRSRDGARTACLRIGSSNPTTS